MLRNKIYYHLKPYLPRVLRMGLRRRYAQARRSVVGDIWPIRPGSERPPAGWPGWPDGKKFAVVLTHDVEGIEGVEKCRKLMQLEQELGFVSSFNFIPEGTYRTPPELREELLRNGFEVGVHDFNHDGHLYDSAATFARKAAGINRYLSEWGAVGFRSGFMLNKLDWLHQLDIAYDASTFDTDPFEPQPEGRGTIFPFMVEGKNGGRSYVELPYTLVQDSTLFLLLREETSEIWMRKLDWIATHGGMALVNIHPDYVDFSEEGSNPNLFPANRIREFLRHVVEKHGGTYWQPLPRNLAQWFTNLNPPTSVSALRRGARPTGTPAPLLRSPVLVGKRAAVLLYSSYPSDPRPRRAAEAMTAAGMEVDVLCLSDDESQLSDEVVSGVHVKRLPWQHSRSGKLMYVWNYLRFILASFTFLAARSWRRHYDVVHVHNMPDVLVFSAIVPRLLGARILLDLHDPMPELMRTIFGLPENHRGVRLLKWLEKLSIGFADAVVTVNQTCRRIFSSRSCDSEKIHVVMNCPDEDIFSLRPPVLTTGGTSEKPFTIMYHGSLVERNGLGLALEAVARVREKVPNIELRIYGNRSPFLESVLASAREQGMEQCVRYLGTKSSEEIAEAIDEADVGIIPNLRNIFTEINTPTRIFEFLFRGKPVIAPSASGIHEVFSESELVCFELGDAGDLANKIEWVITHPEETLEITKRGQAACLPHRWSEERHLLLDLVSDLIAPSTVELQPELAK